MKKITMIILVFMCMFLSSCKAQGGSSGMKDDRKSVLQPIAEEFFYKLKDGKYAECVQYFDDKMKEVLPEDKLKEAWEATTAICGNYVNINKEEFLNQGGYDMVLIYAEYDSQGIVIREVFDSENKVSGLFFSYTTIGESGKAYKLPEDIEEEDVLIGKGTKYELKGKITFPKNFQGKIPCAILVQGSGSTDMDESIGPNKPFRDIAWGLAKHGIATLRYDKRTYTYGSTYTEEDLKKFTVREETIEDAILAANLAKKHDRIDPSKVYIIGHSLGGMLAPRIDKEGGDFAGEIIMAGTLRTLYEVMYDQNMDSINSQNLDDKTKEEYKNTVEEEFKKAKNIINMTDEEAQNAKVFGVNAYYFKDMDLNNVKDIVLSMNKPMLILQGARDFQVYKDKDYKLWQDTLKDKENVEFKLYDKLNHLFLEYEGEDAGTIKEYNVPSNIPDEVIVDIANFIKK